MNRGRFSMFKLFAQSDTAYSSQSKYLKTAGKKHNFNS